MPSKIVLDTNILISYFLNGKFSQLLQYVSDKKILFLRSSQSLIELEAVLNRPKFKKYFTLPIHEYIDFYKQISKSIKIFERFTGCRDCKDNFLIDTAIQGNANFLVSGDKDILELNRQLLPKTVEILTLNEFETMFCGSD